MAIDEPSKNRFEKVKEILREAASGHAAAYGGQPLWELSRAELLEAKLYSVRLIAPDGKQATASCCAHHDSGTAAANSRAARSGLVQGLRGEGPFDGSQFPPLPWGGKPVDGDGRLAES